MCIGEIMSALRTEKGTYQKEVASFLNVSVGTISNYEKGVHNPDLNTLMRLADYYGVTTDYLLGRTSYRFDPKTLNQPLRQDFTRADLVNTTLEMSSEEIEHLLFYVRLMMASHAEGRELTG